MKIIYITRHQNRSGFLVLKHLIENHVQISAIILHRKTKKLNIQLIRPIVIFLYKITCYYYRCKELKTTYSEYLLAKKNNIPIKMISTIKSDGIIKEIRKLNPDLIVLGGGWHELIPPKIISIPDLGIINTHPSYLPSFRGTSITRWQVLKGIKRSGCTVHYVNERFDEGEILAQEHYAIKENQTPQELFDDLGKLGAKLVLEVIRKFEINPRPITIKKQDHLEFNQYFSRWDWDLSKLIIDWNLPLDTIHYMILANTQESYRYPGPFFYYRQDRFFVRATRIINKSNFKQKINDKLNSLNVVSTINDSVFITKKSEANILEIVQLQKFDKFYKFRRAHKANKLLKLKINEAFI